MDHAGVSKRLVRSPLDSLRPRPFRRRVHMQTTTFRSIATTAVISLALPLAGYCQAAASGGVNGNGSATSSETGAGQSANAGTAVSGTMQSPKDQSAPDPSGHDGMSKNGSSQSDVTNGANNGSATGAPGSVNPPGSAGSNPGNPTNPGGSSGQGAASK